MRLLLLLSLLIGTFGCSGQTPQESTDLDQAPPFEEIIKIDVHSHIFRDVPEFVDMMRRSNLKIINICVRGNDLERLHQMEAIAESMHQKYPDLNFIGAHLGSMAFDVEEVAKRLDRFPNFNVEVAARTRDLTRQPREKVRNFFIKYQDRIMYGVDLTLEPDSGDGSGPQDMAAYANDIEERYRNDYRYYAGTGTLEMAGKTVEGIGLPREVLEKFYNRNARRIISNLKFLTATPPVVI